MSLRIIGAKPDGVFEFDNGLGELAAEDQEIAEVVSHFGKIGIDFQCGSIVGFGQIEIAAMLEGQGES